MSAQALRLFTGYAPESAVFHRVTASCRLGRAEECEIRIQDEHVSRRHVSVSYEEGRWWLRDLGSANGLYREQERVAAVPIDGPVQVRLGIEGPFVWCEPEPVAVAPAAPALDAPPPTHTTVMAAYTERYFGKGPGSDGPVGEKTMMIRQAFAQVQKRTRWRYRALLGGLGLVAAAVAGFAYYQHRQLSERTRLAQELFYSMKTLDVDMANVRRLVQDAGHQGGLAQVASYQKRREEMAKNYDRFLSTLKVYDAKLSEQDRLVFRVARVFNECELDMPPEFLAEVGNYIGKWKSTGRFPAAVKSAREKGYDRRIGQELLNQGLPPQFYYLAMQESGFEPFASGPETYMGIAKGMWQFIPKTGAQYGLHIGPLADFRRPDPADDRHDWQKATHAAAMYLGDLYRTDALASGLLVMASYNWGEGRVIKRIQSLPGNPRERNFWKLLTQYRADLPQETYDYVFYIVSAAVIGENPRLFGFDLDPPLAHLEPEAAR